MLLLATTLDTGGAESVLARLALGLRERGYAVHAASVVPAGAVGERLRAAGVPVTSLAPRTKLAAPLALARLGRLLATERIDLLQSFLFHANLLARLAPGRARRVVSVRIIEAARPHRQAIERALAPLADRIVCVSEHARRALARAADRRYRTIHNGVPIPPAAAARAPDAPWMAVGRLFPQKGYDILLEAWRRLGPEAPPLEIAGRGPLEAELRARAAGLRVRFLGERSNIPDLLASARGFVLASRDEGLASALLEAMAAGLPIVTTSVGGTPEAIRSGVHGLLVPPEDPVALAGAVRALEGDPGRAAALGAAARARAIERFSVDAMVQAYDGLYQEILSGRGGRTS